ncbi:heat shock 70 kDa protein 12A-like [Erpetoichthys calabaricus]|uniref:Heat shock 70 kDa protein 12A-like n=1 Tax=Erpetoichthys calabaricus TaxID=27687 RepID=A0A8C4T1L7_ERPCA|nr:heat shock 70 kDa protein 12A-like [Erpetoichthys calabaricus]
MSAPSLLIAVDFGTAYSGYCFSVDANHEATLTNKTYQTDTVVLFNENQEFVGFGEKALAVYTKMQSSQACRFYFFQNFKMELYTQNITENLMISAKDGKQLPAIKVFSESLRYLKEHALSTVKANVPDFQFVPQDITWVLTVPAIWNNAAKEFMRRAAKEAGLIEDILSENLILALEPEAASLWCKQLPSTGFIEEHLEGSDELKVQQKPGTRYVVVDCGGGTVDITVHEVLEDGSLNELQKASGGGWGSFSVDEKFQNFLRELFGPVVWDIYELEYPSELLKMMHNFSIQKCTENNDIYIICPYNLAKLASAVQEISSFFNQVEGVYWSEGNIKLTYSKLASFFDESIKNIVRMIKEILDTPEIDINFILLVGGYASNGRLREVVRKEFSSQCKILCPCESQQAIAKGAIMFGTDPKIIRSRVSPMTYGVSVCKPFDPNKHNPNMISVNKTGGDCYCTGLFQRLVEKDQPVNFDDVSEFMFFPVNVDQTEACFDFFATDQSDAMYINDQGVQKVGSFVLPMPDITLGRYREIKMEVRFGLSEIKANATDLSSGESGKTEIKFILK